MWTALDISIGLALCYALVSLICSVIQEFIAQIFDSRAKLLTESLRVIKLEPIIAALSEQAVANPGWLVHIPWFHKWGTTQAKSAERWSSKFGLLIDKWTGGPRIPHNIKADVLAKTIMSELAVVTNGQFAGQTDAAIDALLIPKGLKTRLKTLSMTARGSLDTVTKDVTKWSQDFLDQTTHWYARRAQAISLVLGVIVALAMNVDTIEIAQQLMANPAKREAAVSLAKKLTEDGKLEGCPAPATQPKSELAAPKTPEQFKHELQNCMNAVEDAYPLPIGWDVPDIFKGKSLFASIGALFALIGGIGFTKWIGLLLTGLALSLGSRFWFDMLKNLVALRTGGVADKKAS